MSQLQTSVTDVTRKPLGASLPASRLAAASAVIAVTVLVALAIAAFLRPNVPAPPSAADSGVTDGWMHGSAAYGITRTSDVTDGWAGRYLPSAGSTQVTDGWAGRYLPSARDD